MHRLRMLPGVALAAAVLAGCGPRTSRHVDGGELGRVVIYRNGVAFYERSARVEDGRVTVRVPRDKVDDFLKSLTVVDRITRKPLAVTIPRREAEDGSYLTMTLETPDRVTADVQLTYVTAAPAWKPSYRVVVGDRGKVMLEGWAIVDNTTTEDWNRVRVGVGASSALAFRYDLWSVRQVDRDLLAGEERFAVAPPAGVAPYDDRGSPEELGSLDGIELRPGAGTAGAAPAAPAGRTFGEVLGGGSTSQESTYVVDGVNTTGLTFGTGGTIAGTVVDDKTREPLPGASVVATGPALRGEQVVLTDEQGRYELKALPPGTYTLTLYYGDHTVARPNIQVTAGKSTTVPLKMSGAMGGGETIEVQARAPMIDQSTTSLGYSVVRSLPGVMSRAPGAQSLSPSAPPPPSPVKRGDDKLTAIARRVVADRRDVVIEVSGRPGGEAQVAERGNAVKNKLVNDGVPAARIRIVPKIGASHADGVRVLAVAAGRAGTDATAAPPSATRGPAADTPVGESHFMADRPMTVRAGSSAMVAMVHGETTGGVVYLYDPISDRGDARFAFKAVRLDNPTADTLEPGPVTVYGDGRFIGEGITEPVPPKASVVVPFALDRQIVVAREGHDEDRIARLLTVQRGVITAEVQHRRRTRFAVTSRLTVPTTVYLRHRVATGWNLVTAPATPAMKVGDSQLFELALRPGGTSHVELVEATPAQRTLDLAAPEALGLIRVFVDEPDASPQLKAQLTAMLATHRTAADLGDRIETLRAQLAEYRSRSGELHAQLVTLKAVRTGGELMAALRARLVEMSDRTQRATLGLVEAQEQLMLARVKFQNQLADLKLSDAAAPAGLSAQ